VLSNKVLDLFKFSNGVSLNNQGGCVTLMWLAALERLQKNGRLHEV